MARQTCPQCRTDCDESHRFCPSCGFPIAEARPDSSDPLIGKTLPGGYTILDIIGVGGMGRVYRAEQRALGRTVAVKIIHPHLVHDESASARFITEARAASRLNHPNSVGVIDFGRNEGQLYLVMEFLRGRDLARIAYEQGPLPFRRIVDVLRQVLAALAEAHELGIIHRDLKPENIVLDPTRSGGDFVKVVDFGLAMMLQGAPTPGITSPGIVCGTPDYMSPEQVRGDPVDPRSDLYACGVILFQLLTGRLPFEAESPTQVVLMHLSTPAPDPAAAAPDREIPEELSRVTLRALGKEADARYQSADDFSAALQDALASAEGSPARGSRPSIEPSLMCTSCGALMAAGQKFCGDCGARLGGGAPHSVSPATAMRRTSLPPLPLPLVGRETDLEWLEERRNELGHAVAGIQIVGEHGVGKTRLLKEFLGVVEAAGDHVVLVGPDPWWADVGYYALRQAIIGLASLPRGGGGEPEWIDASVEARRGLHEVFGDAARPTTRGRALSLGPARPLTTEERRYVVAEALRWAISRARAVAARHRVIVAVEDLNRIDGASRNAFSDVLAEPPLASVLFLATHVPSFDPGWPASTRTLGGLPVSVAANLTKGVMTPNPSTSGGERMVPPLYLDQLVRYRTEGGTEPPSRIADLIAARMQRLPQEARVVLQVLSVAGDEAEESTLNQLAPDGTHVRAGLARLEQLGMVQFTAAGVSMTHPLLREVVAATTPAAVRRELHATAGRWAQERGLPLEVVASHAVAAQNAFEALMLLEQLADRAETRGDLGGAVLSLRRGLDLARREIFRGEIDDPLRAVMIFSCKLGEALARAGDPLGGDGVLREALDLAGPAGSDRARLLGALANVAMLRERPHDATRYLHEAVDLARRANSRDLLASLEEMQRRWAS